MRLFARLCSVCALAALAVASLPCGSAREVWPEPSAEDKRRAAEIKAADAALWARVKPEVEAWAAKGKPFIPWAAKPEDLPQASVPAFPGAEGGGKFSFGGRGGKIFVVTSLADSGAGTFREACEAAGPRIVVFNVAGVIRLATAVHIRAPYITIAGQSAPGDGVCLAGATVAIDTHDVVIRYVRFRRGEANVMDRDDSLGGHPVGNLIIDHVSASWGFDENISLYRHMYSPGDGKPDLKLPLVNVTIQWSISSEAMDTFNHAFGGTWGGRNSTFHHNLFASNTGRNPSVGMSWDFTLANCVLFNWRHRTMDGGDDTSRWNVINNYLKPGPETNTAATIGHRLINAPRKWSKKDPVDRWGKAHVAGNIVEGNARVTADNWDGGVQFTPNPEEELRTHLGQITDPARLAPLIAEVRSVEPLPHAPITIEPAAQAFESVLARSGATLPRRDVVDERVVREVRTGQVTFVAGKGIIKDIADIGGFPEYRGMPWPDVGADGIPLWWKKKHGLDAKDAELASRDLQGDGYTVIEKFLNGLDPTKKIDWSDPRSHVNTLTAAAFRPDAPFPGAPADEDAAYSKKIEERTAKLVADLKLGDRAKEQAVHAIVIAQYRALNRWHDAYDAKVKVLAKKAAAKDEAGAAAKAELEAVKSTLRPARAEFLAKLGAVLPPEKVEEVKDLLTYHKVRVTFDAYCQQQPKLTEEDKAKILAWLKEAREEAIDGGSADEKSEVFGRFKGRINNYLSQRGFVAPKGGKPAPAKETVAPATKS